MREYKQVSGCISKVYGKEIRRKSDSGVTGKESSSGTLVHRNGAHHTPRSKRISCKSIASHVSIFRRESLVRYIYI